MSLSGGDGAGRDDPGAADDHRRPCRVPRRVHRAPAAALERELSAIEWRHASAWSPGPAGGSARRWPPALSARRTPGRAARPGRAGARCGRCRAAGDVLIVPADVTDPAAVEAAFAPVEATTGDRSRCSSCNAGAGFAAPLADTTDEDWARMLELNLTAPFRLHPPGGTGDGRAGLGPHRRDRLGRGQARRGRRSPPTPRPSTACSAWSARRPRSCARTGVTVNAVCPGYVDTPMTDATVGGDRGSHRPQPGRGARRARPGGSRSAG